MTAFEPGRGYSAVRAAVLGRGQIEEADLTAATPLTDLGLDSLGTLELMLHCEEQLNVSLLTEDAPEVYTVGDVARFIDERLRLGEAS